MQELRQIVGLAVFRLGVWIMRQGAGMCGLDMKVTAFDGQKRRIFGLGAPLTNADLDKDLDKE